MRDGPDFVVVVGGGSGSPAWRSLVPVGAVVVAADSGVDLARAGGIAVHHVVGDLDSASAEAVADARKTGAVVHPHPSDKDATDSELAVELVVELHRGDPAAGHGATPRLLVLGGGGGRVDHLLADLHLVADDRLSGFEVTARLGEAVVHVVRPERPRSLLAAVGEQVSLLPAVGVVRGVTTSGLRWALDDADLAAGSTRGLSNEVVAGPASVSIDQGVLIVVEPGTVAPPVPDRATPYDPTPRLG